MKGLNYPQHYFIPVTNQNITEGEIQQILRYIIQMTEDVANYDINEKLIKFQFDGQQYLTLYDYFQLLKQKKLPFSFKIIIEITIKIFNSFLEYKENSLEVNLSLENIWIYFGKDYIVSEQIKNLTVHLIFAQCFESQEKIIIRDQIYEFQKKLKQELQNLQSQYKMKELCEQFFFAINNPDIQTAKAQLQKLIIKEDPNLQQISLEKDIIYLRDKLYSIFSYITKLGLVFRDNLINWIIKDINLKYIIQHKDLSEILIFLRLKEIQSLLQYLKEQKLNIDEDIVTVYLCQGKFLNSLEDLRNFKFQDLKLHLDQQNKIKKQFDQRIILLSYFQKHYPNFSQQLQQYNFDQLENLKQINDKMIMMINQKIDSRIKEFFPNITKLYKMTQEQFDKWFDQQQKKLIFEKIMKLIEQNLLNKQIQFEKLNAEDDLISNFIEQSIEEITMQLIMEKNKVIVETLLYQEYQNKMEMEQF